MTTSFIRQQINMGIHDIMYQVCQQLVDIVKPMVHNGVQQAKEQENRRALRAVTRLILAPLAKEYL